MTIKDKNSIELLNDIKSLTSLEEMIVRMVGGHSNKDIQLRKKSDDPLILARLLQIEEDIMKKAKRKLPCHS